MTNCLGKNYSFGLLCVSFVKIYQFCVFSSFPCSFEVKYVDLIVLFPGHCLSIFFLAASHFKFYCQDILYCYT